MRPGNAHRFAALVGSALILLAALLAITPELIHGPSCGHDFDFHLSSWLDAQAAWRGGLLYPHWAPSANFGAGEARFIFYPPLTWMLGALLGFILPWTLAPAALTFLLLAGTGLATRALGRQFLSDGAATLAGCVALFSGYSLFTAYERTAFGELAGGFWIPLLLLFALRQFDPNKLGAPGPAFGTWETTNSNSFVTGHDFSRADQAPQTNRALAPAEPLSNRSTLSQALDGSALPLALIVAGAWLSNAPVGVMASYLLAFVALVAAVKARSWVSVLRAGVGAALGLGLSAAYLIPAAHQQRWVSISQATDDPGERIENSFLFGHHADAALALHDVELHRVSLLAVSMLLLALVGFVVAWKRGYFSIAKKHREKHPSGAKAPESFEGGIGTTEVVPCYKTGGESRISRDEFSFTKEKQRVYEVPAAESAYLGQGRWWLVITLLPLAILLLQLPISLPVWNLLPKLRFLQFPWRWLVCLEAPMGILVAAAIWPARRWTRVAVVVLCAVVFVGATAFTARSFYQVCDDEDSVPGMLTAYHSGAGFVGTDEYAPLGADNTLAASGLPAACLVSDPTTPLGEAAPSQEGGDAPTPVWKPEQGACEPIHLGAMESFPRPEYWHFAATTPHAGYLILRLRSYPAWRIKLNGRIVSNLPRRDDGLIAIPVSQGPVELTVDWTLTPDQLLGRWLSLLAVLLFAGLWILERRHSRRHLS